jgi:hypothetical protein
MGRSTSAHRYRLCLYPQRPFELSSRILAFPCEDAVGAEGNREYVSERGAAVLKMPKYILAASADAVAHAVPTLPSASLPLDQAVLTECHNSVLLNGESK